MKLKEKKVFYFINDGTDKVRTMFFTWPALHWMLMSEKKGIYIFAEDERTRNNVYKEPLANLSEFFIRFKTIFCQGFMSLFIF